jgi:hypothetical protein
MRAVMRDECFARFKIFGKLPRLTREHRNTIL